jgi:hypothetical protein
VIADSAVRPQFSMPSAVNIPKSFGPDTSPVASGSISGQVPPAGFAKSSSLTGTQRPNAFEPPKSPARPSSNPQDLLDEAEKRRRKTPSGAVAQNY